MALKTLGFGCESWATHHRFSGRVALVTGGVERHRRWQSSGGCSRKGRGWHRSTSSGPPYDGALALTGDVSDSARSSAAVAEDEAELGPIDVLVCSARRPGCVAARRSTSRRGVAARARRQRRRRLLLQPRRHPGMVERGYGRIVNVASIAGKEGNPMAGAYSASKAAVIAHDEGDRRRTSPVPGCS